MAGGIPRYHSHLDYHRPSGRSPTADMWGQINRGVQGALSGFMKHQQEKEDNTLQEGTGAFYSSINDSMSQEDIAKKALEIEKVYKFNKNSIAKFRLQVGRIVKQAPTQEQLDIHTAEQEGITKQKELNKRTKINRNFIKNVLTDMKDAGRKALFQLDGSLLNEENNMKVKREIAKKKFDEFKNNPDILIKAGVTENDIPTVLADIEKEFEGSLVDKGTITRMQRAEEQRRKKIVSKADKLTDDLIKKAEQLTAKGEAKANIYAKKKVNFFTGLNKTLIALQSPGVAMEGVTETKVIRSTLANLLTFAKEAIEIKDKKSLFDVGESFNKIVKLAMEGGAISSEVNAGFIEDLKKGKLQEKIGKIVGYRSKESVEVTILDPIPKTKKLNDITPANIENVKKYLGRNTMRELYRIFRPYINTTTEENKKLSEIFIFNYITEYGEPNGI